MLQEILTNSYVQAAIAVVIALVIAKLLKIVIDYKKLLPLIASIIALIFKEEEKVATNTQKNKDVTKAITEAFSEKNQGFLKKKFGSIPKAVDKIYKVAKPIIKGTSILRVLKKL